MKRLITIPLVLLISLSLYLNYKMFQFAIQCEKYFGYIDSTLAQHEDWRDDDNDKIICKFITKDECKQKQKETSDKMEKHYNQRWDYLSEMEWANRHPLMAIKEAFKLYKYKRPDNIKKHEGDTCEYKGKKVYVYGEQTRGYSVNPDDHTGTLYVMFENEGELKNCVDIETQIKNEKEKNK